MKIAYLSADSGIPVFGHKGASVHIRELSNALCAAGNEVTIFAATRGIEEGTLSARVVEINSNAATPSEGFDANGEYGKILERERRGLQTSAVLERLLTFGKEKFDLIYERYSLWSTAGVRAARALKIPCLIEVNSPLLEEQRRYRGLILESEAEAIEREVFGGAQMLLAVSEEVKSYVVAKGADPERTFVIPNGVDINLFNPAVPAEPLEGLEGKFVLGFVGSFKTWHGLDVLLEAFRTLADHSSAYHLLLVGDGPQRNWIEGYVRGARLDSAVTITGWIPYERLPQFIQRMDITVAPYPAMDNFYFSPLKLFEYMAVGRPVVASGIGQIGEVIQDGVTGLLVQPGDPWDLASKIERLREQPALRKVLGLSASREATVHTWEHNADRLLALADRLVIKE